MSRLLPISAQTPLCVGTRAVARLSPPLSTSARRSFARSITSHPSMSVRATAVAAGTRSVSDAFEDCRKRGRYVPPHPYTVSPPLVHHHIGPLTHPSTSYYLLSFLTQYFEPRFPRHSSSATPRRPAPPPFLPPSSHLRSAPCPPPHSPLCRTALIPFVVAGDPDLATTEKALLALDAAGADIIELGVPYSDPLADGPTIQAAAVRALNAGCTVDKVGRWYGL